MTQHVEFSKITVIFQYHQAFESSPDLRQVMADGSIGTVHYFSTGHKGFPKERLEIFCAGRILQMDNFRKLRGYGWPNFKKMNLFSQNKGHEEEVKQFIDSIKDGKSAPIPFEEIVETTKISLNLASD